MTPSSLVDDTTFQTNTLTLYIEDEGSAVNSQVSSGNVGEK
jgi:hypothetical protein